MSSYEPILKAFQDLLKFFITNNVDTGNRTNDSLVIVFLLAMMSFIFNFDLTSISFVIKRALHRLSCSRFFKKDLEDLNILSTYNYYKNIGSLEETKKWVVYLPVSFGDDFDQLFAHKFCHYISTLKYAISSRVYANSEKCTVYNSFSLLTNLVNKSPIYINSKGSVHIKTKARNS
jgi:hypothetical protein